VTDLSTLGLRARRKWTPRILFGILAYLALVVIGLLSTPNFLWDEVHDEVVIVVGALGLWRFGWWTNHALRAWIYGRFVYPVARSNADLAWSQGARPGRLHFMVTTFRERADTTLAVVRSIISEVRATGLGATIWLGSGDVSDELLFEEILCREARDLDLDLVIARQDRSGKRYAIGMALRAMRRAGIGANDIVVFMDGDAVIVPGAMSKCVPLFAVDHTLQALTTDEEVVVYGPRWVAVWLTMRFAQRRLTMQSHALSGKVLTLTGRLSIYRSDHVTRPEFIQIVEEDNLEHWLWGRFRFLSGDDKSTWYYMLREGARMVYVPDALSITIEHIEGNGYERMVQNLRRWSGNMLRNGSRAIALGPRKVGPFIWWCLVDQRVAMWTMLFSPVLVVVASSLTTVQFVSTYITWVLATRLLQASVLWVYSRNIYLSYPVYLYLNQLLNASVKVYCIFHVSKQRWTNRGDQRAGFGSGGADTLRGAAAKYLTFVSCTGLVILIITYTKLIRSPSSYTFINVISDLVRL
jgi:glycosyltransferase Alg8